MTTATANLTHTIWCNPVEHALYADDMEGTGQDSYCLSRSLTVTMADGQELGGWWTSPHGLPVFVADQPIDAEYTPGGARTMLATLDGATSVLADGLRALLTEALEELDPDDEDAAVVAITLRDGLREARRWLWYGTDLLAVEGTLGDEEQVGAVVEAFADLLDRSLRAAA